MTDTYSVLAAPGHSYPVEARAVRPSPPGHAEGAEEAALAHAAWFLGLAETRASINHETALAHSAVWACVRLITQALAGVCWGVHERSADGRRRMEVEDNEAWLLDLQANPEMSAFCWREVMVKNALTWGNAFSEIERAGSGRARWLWPIHPSRVTPFRADDGALVYQVEQGPGLRPTYLAARDVFHLRGMGPDGIVGYSVIELARKSIELGLDLENYGLQAFSNGPLPGGFLKVPHKLSPEQQREMRRSFEAAYTGKANGRRVVVLHGGAEFTPGMLPNDDAQFLESRRFQTTDVAVWFLVPPHKVGNLERATFSNIEEQELAFVRDCLGAWARRLETEADIKLFGPVQTGRRYTKLDLEPLTRGTAQQQAQTVSTKVSGGLKTINEGRAYFGDDPIDGGDTPLIQGAMVPLERLLEPPEPPPPAAPPPPAPAPEEEEEEGEEGGAAAEARAAFAELLGGVYERLIHVEAEKAGRAGKRGELASWAAEFYPGHEARARALLAPVFAGLLAALRRPAAGAAALAAAAAARHCDASALKLQTGVDWPGRARAQAEADIKGVLS